MYTCMNEDVYKYREKNVYRNNRAVSAGRKYEKNGAHVCYTLSDKKAPLIEGHYRLCSCLKSKAIYIYIQANSFSSTDTSVFENEIYT